DLLFRGQGLVARIRIRRCVSKRREGSQREDFTRLIHRRRTGPPAGSSCPGRFRPEPVLESPRGGSPPPAPLRRRRRAVPVLLLFCNMPILRFPDPRQAGPEGLVALGGDLHPKSLLLAYRQGIFPWPV